MKTILIILFLLTFTFAQNSVYIRTNQLAFLPNDYKSALVLSNNNLEGKRFQIIDENEKAVYEGKVNSTKQSYGEFRYLNKIDFSTLSIKGSFKIKIENRKSFSFKIGNGDYKRVVKSLLDFFKIQRCGYTDPHMHSTCHIADATSIVYKDQMFDEQIDVTGGWHDAGDYVKFLNTTAYSTYMLLFSYEFNKKFFGFDLDNNQVPDILDEAKIGVDWLLRCQYKNNLVVQVQNLQDHTVGWRLPENDTLKFNRPAYIDNGKNLIGIYSATLALAAKIWKEDIKYPEYANKCLMLAQKFYKMKERVPDIAKAGSGMYVDSHFEGKLALAAVELYRSTRNKMYLSDAKKYASEAGSDMWWSWGNINSLAHYRISRFDKSYLQYLKDNLDHFNKTKRSMPFEEGAIYSWGTNNTLLGISLQSILYKKRTRSKEYNRLASIQRDYVLGRNPWGISFFFGFGTHYSKYLHHQVAYFNKNKLPGGFAAGPIEKSILDGYSIPYEKNDRLRKFQTDSCYYRDDRFDYVSNEPTITAAATAIFVMGYYASN